MLSIALVVIFLLIFVATAILTLASLPGWIKIPDGYRKALFSALLLEVVACIVLLFRQMYIDKQDVITIDEPAPPPVIKPADDWVAIDFEGHLLQPTVNDQPIGMKIDEYVKRVRRSSIYHISKEADPSDTSQQDFVVKNDEAVHRILGRVSRMSLTDSGLFDQINPDENEFVRLQFKNQDDKWQAEESLPSSWSIAIRCSDNQYSIVDKATGDAYVQNNTFDRKNRKLHFIHADDNNYYLIRISDAVLNDGDKNFVAFMALRLTPELAKD